MKYSLSPSVKRKIHWAVAVTVFGLFVAWVYQRALYVPSVLRHDLRQMPLIGQRIPAEAPTRIGWVSDIHADRFKRRDVDSGRLYPRQYADYLPKVFDALRHQGITTVVATGDNTNSGDDNYARALVKIAADKHMDVIWVRGNHDNDHVMNILGVDPKNYFFRDFGDTRLIVLKNAGNEGPDSYTYDGSIDDEQLNWLREALRTDKQVIIALHIPIVYKGNIVAPYTELNRILRERGNVKMVLSGHYHIRWNEQFDGIDYYGESTLTRDGEQGGYGIVDFKNRTVDYLYAQ